MTFPWLQICESLIGAALYLFVFLYYEGRQSPIETNVILYFILYFGMYHHVLRRKSVDVLEKYVSSILRVEE